MYNLLAYLELKNPYNPSRSHEPLSTRFLNLIDNGSLILIGL